MQKIWKVKKADIVLQKKLSSGLDISPFLAQLLINRGIATPGAAEEFLYSGSSSFHQAKLLPDIDKAQARVQKALQEQEKVLIFSDYDADGLTSLAVLKIAFSRMGLNHEHYIPHRLKEGYGLSEDAVKYAKSRGFSLLITLDCGMTDFKEIAELKKLGIDTIVIDHHNVVSDTLPPAYAIINPKCRDSQYPYQDLAGVGLTYKFAGYLLDSPLEEELDLVCLGTIADMVSLVGENRIIVREGLKRLGNTKRPGLRALMEVSGIKNKPLNTEYVSYILAPRINACGRLGSCEDALSLLLSDSDAESFLLAKELHAKNKERSRIGANVLAEALSRLESEIDFARERVIILSQENWHPGVLGIVAAKLTEKFHRPAIIVSFINGIGKGSGRSIENFHLFDGLYECRQHLEGFGGHKRACGLSILEHNIEHFRKEINRIALEKLCPEDLLPNLAIDLHLELSDLNSQLVDELNLLEPFGQANPKPLFSSSNLKVKSKPVVLGRNTLKFWVSDGKVTYPAVGFGMSDYFDLVNSAAAVNLAYRLSWDNWNGAQELQLELVDIRATASLPYRP